MLKQVVQFPEFTGARCLMMPYVQGDPCSVPGAYAPYRQILESTYHQMGEIGFLTIDESVAVDGTPHRGTRARFGRAIHTEAGRYPGTSVYKWGGSWGRGVNVMLDRGVRVLLASNADDSCAIWDIEHEDTSEDGDIGHMAHLYPYRDATVLRAGEVHEIGILTPHESLPVKRTIHRQFLRIISAGVRGREDYFTVNPYLTKGPS